LRPKMWVEHSGCNGSIGKVAGTSAQQQRHQKQKQWIELVLCFLIRVVGVDLCQGLLHGIELAPFFDLLSPCMHMPNQGTRAHTTITKTQASQQASKQASEQASKQASAQASKHIQAPNHRSTLECKQAPQALEPTVIQADWLCVPMQPGHVHTTRTQKFNTRSTTCEPHNPQNHRAAREPRPQTHTCVCART
jgi:hypothetical protein